MTPPDSIKVGPYTFTVHVGGKHWNRSLRDEPDSEDRASNGRTHADQCRIVVRKGLAAHVERMVVLHEVMHACVTVADVFDLLDPKDPEENAIRAITPTLLAVLRDNPELAAYLLGDA